MRVEDETDVLDALKDKIILECSDHEVGAFQGTAILKAFHYLFPLCNLRANEQLKSLKDPTCQAFPIWLMRVNELKVWIFVIPSTEIQLSQKGKEQVPYFFLKLLGGELIVDELEDWLVADKVVVLEEFYDVEEIFGARKFHGFVWGLWVKYVDELIEEPEYDDQLLLWWRLLENGCDFFDALLGDNIIELSDILGHILQNECKAIFHLIQTNLSDILIDNIADLFLDLHQILLFLFCFQLILDVLEDILDIFPEIVLNQAVDLDKDEGFQLIFFLLFAIFYIKVYTAERNVRI